MKLYAELHATDKLTLCTSAKNSYEDNVKIPALGLVRWPSTLSDMLLRLIPEFDPWDLHGGIKN